MGDRCFRKSWNANELSIVALCSALYISAPIVVWWKIIFGYKRRYVLISDFMPHDAVAVVGTVKCECTFEKAVYTEQLWLVHS